MSRIVELKALKAAPMYLKSLFAVAMVIYLPVIYTV